jgi:hypothetical protein
VIFYFPVCILLLLKSFNSNRLFENLFNVTLYFYIFLLGALKYKVGADYANYELIYKLINEGTYLTDLVFVYINTLAHDSGWGYRGVHIIVSAICTFATFIFVRIKKISIEFETFLLLFFIIMASFGYLRQGISVAFLMCFEISRHRGLRLLFGIAAVGSHLPSLVYILFRMFIHFDYESSRLKFRKYFLVLLPLIIIFIIIAAHSLRGGLYAELKSSGVFYRIIVYFLPILLIGTVVIFRSRLKFSLILPVMISICAIFLSTLIDRILIYFIPLVVLYSNQYVRSTQFLEPILYKYLMMFSYFFLFFVWLLFAPYGSEFWLNYDWSLI